MGHGTSVPIADAHVLRDIVEHCDFDLFVLRKVSKTALPPVMNSAIGDSLDAVGLSSQASIHLHCLIQGI
jgi:hypothetical protein